MRLQELRHAQARRGAAVVEMALVLSILLGSLVGVFEYGRLVMIRQLLDNAAREGARLAVVGTASQPPITTDQIREVATNALSGQALDNVSIQVYLADPVTGANVGSWELAEYGKPIMVRVEADYAPSVPGILGLASGSLHLTAVSMMLSEAN